MELSFSALDMILVIALIGAIVVYELYSYTMMHRTKSTIIPQYEPYPGIKPMYAGYLINKRLDARDIVAGIVYLAEQGFIKIRKTEQKVLFFFEVDNYEITLTREMSEITDPCERKVAQLLFLGKTPVGTKTSLLELQNIQFKSREGNTPFFLDLSWKMQRELVRQGYLFGFDLSTLFFRNILLGIGVLVLFFVLFPSVNLFIISIMSLVLLFETLLVLFSGRRTAKGYHALDHLLGFKEYLSVVETERYVFHNAPEKNAEQFMEYLPYAIAFGVEKEWAKTFEGISDFTPDWYSGSGTLFTLGLISLSKSLGGFSSSLVATSGASTHGGNNLP